MVTDIIVRIISAVLAAFAGAFARARLFPERSVFPTKVKPDGPYSQLNGEWFQYLVTRDLTVKSKPFWECERVNLRVVKGVFVEGESENITHAAKLKYKIRGEIRGGRMLLTCDGANEPSEFASITFPNLLGLARGLVVGNWIGFDYQWRFVTGPCILSRNQLSDAEPDKIAGTDPSIISLLKAESER